MSLPKVFNEIVGKVTLDEVTPNSGHGLLVGLRDEAGNVVAWASAADSYGIAKRIMRCLNAFASVPTTDIPESLPSGGKP